MNLVIIESFEKLIAKIQNDIDNEDNTIQNDIDNEDKTIQNKFRLKLGAKILTEHKKGHFSGGDGVKKLPIVLKSVLNISK